MYVMSAVSSGKPFSQAVREAVELGYAEPDPRDDLTGRDAARKALILARLLGYRGPAPVAQDLVPRSLKKVPAADVPGPVAGVRRRVGGAGGGGSQTWTRAALRRDRDAAQRSRRSLRRCRRPARSGALEGTRNLVAFTTRRYRTEPLVISGPGAGAEVTAAGILNDIYSLSAR